MDPHESEQPNNKRRLRWYAWIGRFVLGILLVGTLLLVVIHIPPVQRWGIQKLTKSMSSVLDTRVQIKGFSFSPISDLTLKQVYIGSPDSPGDTLLYSHRLSVDYRRIWDLLKNQFHLSQLRISKGVLRIHRLPDAELTNLDLALMRLLPPRDTTKQPFVLDLERIKGTDVRVVIDDETNGALIQIDLARADVEVDTLDVAGNFISIPFLDLDNPKISVINRVVEYDTGRQAQGTTGKSWSFDIHHLRIRDAHFVTDHQSKQPLLYPDPQGIDYAHMVMEEADIRADSVVIRGWDFKGQHIDMHLRDQNGFEIKKLSAAKANVSRDGILADDFKLVTARSTIHNSIRLHFSGFTDFQKFTDSVRIDIPAAQMNVYVQDLLALAPGLQGVEFFNQNADKNITLQGTVNGTVNQLRIDGMHAAVGGVEIAGMLRAKGLARRYQQELSLDVLSSSVSAASLNRIFPRMNIPAEFDRAGQIGFIGKFEGKPKDFSASGTFTTSLGNIALDMDLNILEGVANGKYSGKVNMQSFDLGKLTGTKDLGRITFSGQVVDGVGLNVSNLQAHLIGEVSALTYKGYTYHEATVDGKLTGSLFDGRLNIRDPNLQMHFTGRADFSESAPALYFVASVDLIRFMPLGFSKEPIELSGYFDFDLQAQSLDRANGRVTAENLKVKYYDGEYQLDTLFLHAGFDTLTQSRWYSINSDIMSGMIAGVFNPVTLPREVHHYLHDQYPSAIRKPAKELDSLRSHRVHWDLEIHDSQHWLDLVHIPKLRFVNTGTSGSIDLIDSEAIGQIDLPEIHFRGVNAYGSMISFREDDGTMDLEVDVIAADVKEDFFFEDVYIAGLITDDSLYMRFKTDDLADIIDEIDLDIKADPHRGTWNIALLPRKLKMIGSDWHIPAGNKVEIRKDHFSLENVSLVSGDQRIVLEDIQQRGIRADIDGFDISYLNSLWINDKFQFSGQYNLDLVIDDLYDIQQLNSVLLIPDLKVNNIPYGRWELTSAMQDPKDSVRIELDMVHNETMLTASGAYLPPIKSIPKDQQNYLRLALNTTDFPLDFLEFLLGGNIRDTEGSVNMSLALSGKANKLNPRGTGRVFNGSTTIDYLGAGYSFHNQSFRITESMIDLSGITLYDVLGNTAQVQGGITHQYLRNLGLNATVTSDKILGLDVTEQENNVFYGRGIGSLRASFTGTVSNPVMNIVTTTARGTHIYIPLSGGTESATRDFVVFLENGLLPATKPTTINFGGIELSMTMNITEDAIVEIIFDDRTGEILQGIGNGSIDMQMSRTGNFSMYGSYAIERGNYLFTNFRIIRKPFEILRGGTIRWDGDPYNANLHVATKYKGLTAPVYTLIQEYLTNATNEVLQQAQERTEVDLTMTLTGSLLSPAIAFDISFPNLTGEIKGYTDSKINSLKANENAMLEQVMGLLVARSFLPSSTASTAVLSKGINNTVSEFFSATLSSYLGGVLGNLIPEGSVITGIDLQVALDLPITSSGGGNGSTLDPLGAYDTEVGVSLPIEFFNDRLTVNVGGNYVTGAPLEVQQYFAGDVTFEYWITPDRRLKVRAYNRNTLTIEGRKNKIGVGIAYRREYDSLKDFLGGKKKKKN